jgi:hypothetical protein
MILQGKVKGEELLVVKGQKPETARPLPKLLGSPPGRVGAKSPKIRPWLAGDDVAGDFLVCGGQILGADQLRDYLGTSTYSLAQCHARCVNGHGRLYRRR